MKRRWIAFCLMIVLALVTLVGCGGSAGTGASEPGHVASADTVWLESAPDSIDDEAWQPSPINPDSTEAAQGASDLSEQSETGIDSSIGNQGKEPSDSATGTDFSAESRGKDPSAQGKTGEVSQAAIDKDGTYTTKEDVALYLHTYGCLPKNFITKKQAKKLGWEGGSLEKYAPGKCIGGDYFGNYEGLLPDGDYHECDIDTLGRKSRGAKRIIYSDDGRIYYTEDHYESFELLYGEE